MLHDWQSICWPQNNFRMSYSTNSGVWNSIGQFIWEIQTDRLRSKETKSLWMSVKGIWHVASHSLSEVWSCCICNITIHCFKNTVFLIFWVPLATLAKTSGLQMHVLIKKRKTQDLLRFARCTWALHPFLATLTGLELGGTALPHPTSFKYVFQSTAGTSSNLGSKCCRQVWGC